MVRPGQREPSMKYARAAVPPAPSEIAPPALPQPAHDGGTDLRIDRFDPADLAGGLLADVARRERCAELLALGGAPPAAALPGNGDAAHAGIAAAAVGLRLVRNDGGAGPLREVLELVRLLGHGTSSLSNRCSAGLHAKILGDDGTLGDRRLQLRRGA